MSFERKGKKETSKRKRFEVKRMEDGRAMLNCGCARLTHPQWNNIDSFPYAYFARHYILARLLYRVGFLSALRYKRLLEIDRDILHWDLRKGIPFPNGAFDVVYHSHLLEHLDRDPAFFFMKECRRVLKPNGIIRVVVPDLEFLAKRYLRSLCVLEQCDPEDVERSLGEHLQSIYDIFDYFVCDRSIGTEQQPPWVRWVEQAIRGGAARRGQLHRWAYDRYSLGSLLMRAGFSEVRVEKADTSRIVGWTSFNLDTHEDGRVRKPESLYMEAAAAA